MSYLEHIVFWISAVSERSTAAGGRCSNACLICRASRPFSQ
jgi:hypothetical protein